MAKESNGQNSEPKDPDELDPLTFVPKGTLQEEQSFQDYVIRIYRVDTVEPSSEYKIDFPSDSTVWIDSVGEKSRNEHKSDSLFDTTVTLGGVEGDSTYEYEGCFEIFKNGQRVYARRSYKFQVVEMPGISARESRILMGKDITSDGEPDLVVSEWTGGAHCCFLFYVFRIGKEFRKLATIDAAHGDLPPFQDLDGDSNLEIVLYDWTFAYWNASFAFSPAPKVILRFHDNTYRLANDLMRKPAPSQKELEKQAKEVREILKDFGEIPYSSASDLWGVMLDLIYTGHAKLAWQFLDMAWPKDLPGKEGFLNDFRAHLSESPYWPEIQALNSD